MVATIENCFRLEIEWDNSKEYADFLSFCADSTIYAFPGSSGGDSIKYVGYYSMKDYMQIRNYLKSKKPNITE